MSAIAVIDYGMGNLGSVARALRQVAGSQDVVVTDKPEQVLRADRVVFPGQGAMPDCMRSLTESGLADAVIEVAAKRPFLGVCVGQQMLLTSSDEVIGTQELTTPGLGLFSGRVRRLPQVDGNGHRLKVPHMGWNRVRQQVEHPIWALIPDDSYFYFVHSYYAHVDDPLQVAGETEYGVRFTSALVRDNIFATQFHPEKSAAIGLQLYQNFVNWKP